MPRKPKTENIIYDYLLNHFKTRHTDRIANRITRKKIEYKKYPTIESIVNHVLSDEKFCDSSCYDQQELGQTCVSRGTIRKAIKRLIAENKIIISKDGSYELNQHMTQSLSKHPILDIADTIDITVGIPTDMIVLSVSSEYTMSITKYLEAFFYQGDVIFIPLGGKIICMSVLPESVINNSVAAKVTKSAIPLKDRVILALHKFNSKYPKFIYGHNYDLDYHFTHNPEFVEQMASIARDVECNRPYSNIGTMFKNIQDAIANYAEFPLGNTEPDIDPETGEIGISLNDPTIEDWELMDSSIMREVDNEIPKD